MSSYRLSKDKEDAVYDWVYSQLNKYIDADRVIWEDENIDRPLAPYIALSIVAGPVKLGGQAELRHESDTKFSVNAMKRVTVEVKCIGRPDQNYLEILQDSLGKETVLSAFRAKGMAVVSEGDIVSIPERMESGFEDRASMDIGFYYASSVEDDLGKIEHVTGEGEVEEETYPFEIN